MVLFLAQHSDGSGLHRCLTYTYSFIYFLAAPHGMCDLSSLCPLQWKRRVLTTGPPGKSLFDIYINIPARLRKALIIPLYVALSMSREDAKCFVPT